MASHFIAIDRGKDGFRELDFVTGTSSSAAADIELRIKDGAGLTTKDMRLALEAFERFVITRDWVKNASLAFPV
jgi:hypothetical protein